MIRHRITDDDLPAQRFCTGPHHGNRLRMAIAIDEECRCLRARDPPGHDHRFGRGSRLIEQGCIGDLEAGEIDDHGLEVQQGLQPALADLGLIWRIRRIPGRVLQYVALDHGRQDGAVVALAYQRCQNSVLGRYQAKLLQHLRLRQCRTEIERRAAAGSCSERFARSIRRCSRRRSSSASCSRHQAMGRYGGGENRSRRTSQQSRIWASLHRPSCS